jgi:hypothetical protein
MPTKILGNSDAVQVSTGKFFSFITAVLMCLFVTAELQPHQWRLQGVLATKNVAETATIGSQPICVPGASPLDQKRFG